MEKGSIVQATAAKELYPFYATTSCGRTHAIGFPVGMTHFTGINVALAPTKLCLSLF